MIRKAVLGFGLTALPFAALAQGQDAAPLADSGDTAWILVSSAFVILMTLPGLGLFYGGLVRAKNFLSILLQVGAIAAVASVLWVIAGYAMAFGEVTNGWLGSGRGLLLEGLAPLRDGLAVPENSFALFQMTFAAITPALMVGAWADRARFGWVVGFCALWGLVVYAPVAHWMWGGGWLASRFGALDFAGGIVVHTTAGISSLVIALQLGKRDGFPRTLMLPHSPSLTMAGAGLLWVGWFGFNGGSALAADGAAASAIINTHIAASMAAATWLLVERITVGKPTSIGWATGAIAGLATITPAAGFVGVGAAIIIGISAAVVCYYAIQLVKKKLAIDDSLDVFAVHGVGGMLGALLLAPLMATQFGGAGYADGATMGSQFVAQVTAVGIVAIWSAIASAILAVLVSRIFPMRVDKETEITGLDIASHGERAWEMD